MHRSYEEHTLKKAHLGVRWTRKRKQSDVLRTPITTHNAALKHCRQRINTESTDTRIGAYTRIKSTRYLRRV